MKIRTTEDPKIRFLILYLLSDVFFMAIVVSVYKEIKTAERISIRHQYLNSLFKPIL